MGFLDHLLARCMMEIDLRIYCVLYWSIWMHVHAWYYTERSYGVFVLYTVNKAALF